MRGKLAKLFTKQEMLEVFEREPNIARAAEELAEMKGVAVSPQIARYWRKIVMKHDGNQAAADRAIKHGKVLRNPSPQDDIGDLTFIPKVAQRILAIGDIHAPYQHPDTLAFLVALRKQFQPDLCVQIGDETDGHAISFHDSDPDLLSAGQELEKAKKFLAQLHKEFPQLLICDSNHGSLVYRRAKVTGIPAAMIKSYRDILFPSHGAPGWSWGASWHIETALGTVMFKHQKSGSLLSDAAHNRCNLVVGHEHGLFGVEYGASSHSLYWGANTGCLIDRKGLAFAYGKHSLKKPIIGALVIDQGRPLSVPMILNDKGRWTGQL
ncbi:hypothetical protein Axy23_026 [Achromobacter phage vB_AxyP_19-32_Axy23]|uniref:Calcineurin-like phosphoesterase domain-containing protein n=1 Tax=Achromobacter phage vB_AxyP_19-32_Axy23 TaxID=2591047 RepID=A0A514CW55_9CAUD|nr:hypothetical protein Axy23_026 [Achromobacter phage vB_AxyP_19-32_Axy23]